MKCGLLGRKLGHSYSPQIHAHLGSYCYELFEREPEELEDFLKNGDFSAINVTIPYKKDVIPYCTELSDRARRLGAVNTIVRRADGSLIGHNTDYFGFESTIRRTGLDPAGKKVLVFGSGGASNTAVAVLKEMGAQVTIITHKENTPETLRKHGDTKLIVNASPEGMYPKTGTSPADLDLFPQLEGVLDMIYNPARTKLLMDAAARGLVAENGLWMLVAQAKESAEWFTGSSISDEVIASIHRELRLEMENIILIGMPGSGKTTIGKLLASKLHKQFADADQVLSENASTSIPEIFATEGESGFRIRETQTLQELGKQSALVLATGGGCVTREENYPLLHQNGTIFCLNRDISRLPTDGRPLSQAGKLEQMYQVRKPLYERFADYQICNNGNPEETAAQILALLKQEEV